MSDEFGFSSADNPCILQPLFFPASAEKVDIGGNQKSVRFLLDDIVCFLRSGEDEFSDADLSLMARSHYPVIYGEFPSNEIDVKRVMSIVFSEMKFRPDDDMLSIWRNSDYQ